MYRGEAVKTWRKSFELIVRCLVSSPRRDHQFTIHAKLESALVMTNDFVAVTIDFFESPVLTLLSNGIHLVPTQDAAFIENVTLPCMRYRKPPALPQAHRRQTIKTF
jgi:hypothetical protein